PGRSQFGVAKRGDSKWPCPLEGGGHDNRCRGGEMPDAPGFSPRDGLLSMRSAYGPRKVRGVVNYFSSSRRTVASVDGRSPEVFCSSASWPESCHCASSAAGASSTRSLSSSQE